MVVCESVLPIAGASTLVYGSSDGGCTIVCKSERVVGMIKSVASHLNLAPHLVASLDGSKKELLYTGGDVEGQMI